MNTNKNIWATAASSRPLTIEAVSKEGLAHISIIGQISNWSEANSSQVRADIAALGKKHTTAQVYINSEGGSCIEANEIVNVLQDNFEDITIIGGAIVASAASFIFCSFPNKLSKNSQVMIHEPRGYYAGTFKNVSKQLKLLKALEDDYVSVYATKTGKTKEDIIALWNDGDHWMTAKEALADGFADAIEGEETITTEDAQMITAMGSPYQVKATAPTANFKPKNMNQEVLAVSIGLPKDATESQITAKIAEIKTTADTAATLKAQLEQQSRSQKAASIKALLDQAELDKKITPEVRASYEKLAESDIDSVKAIVDGLPKITPISAQMQTGSQGVPGAGADFKYESYEACLEANDAKAFEAYMQDQPQKAQALLDAYYTN